MSGGNEKKRSLVLRGVASVLNTCGNAVVVSYDASAKLAGSVGGIFKKIPGISFKSKTSSSTAAYAHESEKLIEKIKEYEQKIKSIYYEIGMASARLTEDDGDTSQLSESGTVKELLEKIHAYENSVKELRQRINSIEEEKKAEEEKQKEEEKYRRATLMAGRARKGKTRDIQNISVDINSAIKEALIHGDFETASDRAVFDKIASDLLDKEPEIQMLAAAELGKMGNRAAVKVLHAAMQAAEGPLATQIINSLIALADSSSIEILKQASRDTNARVRITSLRGLYKLAPEDKSLRPLFIEAMNDINPEVRKTSATLLGWLDENKAVPALIQCLTDEDERVRKAVVSALANIRDNSSMLPIIRQLQDDSLEVRQKALDAIKVISGQEVTFDLSLKGDDLLKTIEEMKAWWQNVRTSSDANPFTPSSKAPKAKTEPAVDSPAAKDTTPATAKEPEVKAMPEVETPKEDSKKEDPKAEKAKEDVKLKESAAKETPAAKEDKKADEEKAKEDVKSEENKSATDEKVSADKKDDVKKAPVNKNPAKK